LVEAARTFSPIDRIIVVAYVVAYLEFSVAIGMIGRRYVGSVSHYLVAGRELGVHVGIATLAATERCTGSIFVFWKPMNQYFEYPSHASRQGRWNISGLFFPDEVLRRVYRDNALGLLKMGRSGVRRTCEKGQATSGKVSGSGCHCGRSTNPRTLDYPTSAGVGNATTTDRRSFHSE